MKESSVHIQILHLSSLRVSVFIHSTSQAGTCSALLFPTDNIKIGCEHILVKLQLSIKLPRVLSIWREMYNYFIQFNYWTECPWQQQTSKQKHGLVREIAQNAHVML